MRTIDDIEVHMLSDEISDISAILIKNRGITPENERAYFAPTLEDLHDPFLMPDMEKAVNRILEARASSERIVIFGDYDVDGVSSTAILVKFLHEIGCMVSYRLPHRSHDGYGLKSYFFDELKTKDVTLVITVDCGTRDIEPIRYAKSLGIDVIVTDHHAVPEIIPEEVIALLNPKRKDSHYPFPHLAGAGVAFKLVHGIYLTLNPSHKVEKRGTSSSSLKEKGLGDEMLTRYIDLASLGTVADCMPLTGENRTITTLGLRQMRNSDSAGLRKFVSKDSGDSQKGRNSSENQRASSSESLDADIIGFQIGPRINASGRMDTPLTALRWLLASEEKCDEFLSEIEELNTKRQEIVKDYSEKALEAADPTTGVLFYFEETLAHGLIGLVAGKLTEAYNRPSISLCRAHNNRDHLVASCRSPDWCNLVELLDECKEYFVRYGGHRQAAGFTIESSKYEEFQKVIREKFEQKYGTSDILPSKKLIVECKISPKQVSLDTLKKIDEFKPFGIGNRKPHFLLENITILDVKKIGKTGNHLSFSCGEIPGVRFLAWRVEGQLESELQGGNIVSAIIELGKNEWNGKISLQCTLQSILLYE